jgi:predicted nucleic acid-binding protein
VPALLDTGALELLRRRNRRVESLALKHYPPVVCSHVVGEFLHGQLQARVSDSTMVAARVFLAPFEVLMPSARTAEHYAELRVRLAAQGAGSELPDLSCWIAAHAVEHDIPLITTDRALGQLPGIKVHLIGTKNEPVGRTAGLPARASPENGKARKGLPPSALALLALHWAHDYLPGTAALLESLGSATGTMG